MKKIFSFVLLALSLQFISNNCHALENKQANDKFLSRADLYYISTMLRSKPAELDQWDALLMLNGDQDSVIISIEEREMDISNLLIVKKCKVYGMYQVSINHKSSQSKLSDTWNLSYIKESTGLIYVNYSKTAHNIIWLFIFCVIIIFFLKYLQ